MVYRKWTDSQPSQDRSSPIWHQGPARKIPVASGIDVAGTVVPFHDTVKLLGVKPSSYGKFLSQVSCDRKLAGVNGVSGAIFLVQKTGARNWQE